MHPENGKLPSMSVPDFGPAGPSTVVHHSSIRSAQSVYFDRNREAFQQEKKENDDVMEDPITMEEMPEYVPGKTISYLRLTDKNVPVGMRFFTLGALEQCLGEKQQGSVYQSALEECDASPCRDCGEGPCTCTEGVEYL
jgi:hypothetical protein